MDSPCIKQTVCKVLNIFQHGEYLVAYVLNISIEANSVDEIRLLLQEQSDLGPHFLSKRLQLWVDYNFS